MRSNADEKELNYFFGMFIVGFWQVITIYRIRVGYEQFDFCVDCTILVAVTKFFANSILM